MNLLELLGLKTELLSKKEVRLSMFVDSKHLQPYGLMHGGLNAVLAETAASLGANLYCQPESFAVGVDINTHHLKPVSPQTLLIISAKPINIGKSLQVWEATSYVEKTITSFSTITLKIKRNSEKYEK